MTLTLPDFNLKAVKAVARHLYNELVKAEGDPRWEDLPDHSKTDLDKQMFYDCALEALEIGDKAHPATERVAEILKG